MRQSLQRCNRACRCRVFPTSSRHRLLCCNRKHRPADQKVIRSSVQQGLILRGVFKSIFERRVRVPSLSRAQSFCANVCEALPGVGETTVVPLIERPLERAELSQAELWHQGLGHASARRLRGCARVARGVRASLAEHKSCTACKMCKQKAKPRSREASHRLFTATKLSQVSVDLHGPYAQASRGGSKYVAVFVDAATSYMWVDCIPDRQASTTARSVQKFCAELGTPAQFLTDNGTEFQGAFLKCCRLRGIDVRNSEPYWPSRNGLVKRWNSTLKAMSRLTLVQAGLPFDFWGRSIYTACHTMNHLPTKRLHGRTPFEAMHGRAPDLSHMRVFGSICYPLNVVKDPRSMITAPPHIFCGYDQHSQGYVCYDPQSRKFKVRATVQFDESWRCRALSTGAPIQAEDHQLNLGIDDDLPYLLPPTAVPARFLIVPALAPLPATVSPTAVPTTEPSVLPTIASKPIRPRAAPSPSSPSVSKTDVPASFHQMSNGSPAVLCATGKESAQSPYINDRAR